MTLKLRHYQNKCVDFLKHPDPRIDGKPHKILLVDVGLGKTPISCVGARELGVQTALVICPHNIKDTWKQRLVEWGTANHDDIFICRTKKDIIPATAKFIIASPQIIHSTVAIPGTAKKGGLIPRKAKRQGNPLFKQLFARKYDLFLYDEAQSLRSMSSKTTFTVLKRNGSPLAGQANHKWFLSGTLHDKNEHLFPLAKALAPELLGPYADYDEFLKRYCSGYKDEYGNYIPGRSINTKELTERLAPLIYLVKQEDVWDEMPALVEDVIDIPDLGRVNADIKNDASGKVYRETGISKARFVADYLYERLDEGDENILVCAHHREVIDAITKRLEKFNPSVIYGGTTNRTEIIDAFVEKRSRVLVINETACGVGVDRLQLSCNVVVFAENDWTNMAKQQVLGRVMRIGQKHKTVFAVSFTARRSFDVRVVRTQNAKERTVNTFNKYMEKLVMATSEPGLLEQAVNALIRIADVMEKLTAMSVTGTGAATETKSDAKPTGAKGKAGDKETKADKKADEAKAEAKAEAEVIAEADVRKEAAKLISRLKAAGLSAEDAQEAVRSINVKNGTTDKERGLAGVPAENRQQLIADYAAYDPKAEQDEAQGV